jgi:hypothetical protein
MRVSNTPRAGPIFILAGGLDRKPRQRPNPDSSKAHKKLTNAELSLEHSTKSLRLSCGANGIPQLKRPIQDTTCCRWRSGAVTIARTTRAAGSFVRRQPNVVYQYLPQYPTLFCGNTLRGSQPRALPPPARVIGLTGRAVSLPPSTLTKPRYFPSKLGMPSVFREDPSGACGLPCLYKLLLYTTAETVERRLKLIACYTVLWLSGGT